jgi:hypothetical protein
MIKRRHRTDQQIENAWRIFLGLMIFAAACTAVTLAYAAFFAAIGHKWIDSSVYLGLAASLGAGVSWLCYNRNELIGGY